MLTPSRRDKARIKHEFEDFGSKLRLIWNFWRFSVEYTQSICRQLAGDNFSTDALWKLYNSCLKQETNLLTTSSLADNIYSVLLIFAFTLSFHLICF